MVHPFISFRIRLAQHGVKQFVASARSWSELVLVLFGPVLAGLFAMVALPPMYAASQPAGEAAGLLLVHALMMTIPAWLLRKRVLPRDTAQWLHALPVPGRLQLLADLAVAATIIWPLALAYAVSAAIWLVRRPDWLAPVPGTLGTLASLLLTWVCGAAILALRSRVAPGAGRWQRRLAAPATRYVARRMRPRVLFLWQRLYWLPFWREENVVGLRQVLMLAGALACAFAWMLPELPLPRALAGLATSVLLVLMADRGDHAVREQIALLRPHAQAWPVRGSGVELAARLFSLLPALAVLGVLYASGARHGVWDHTAGRLYLALAATTHGLLVFVPRFSPRGRVALVATSILILTAIGSELWN